MEPAPAVAGSSVPRLAPSLSDLARLFLSLSGSLPQRDAAAGVNGAGVLPGPAAPVTSVALLLVRLRVSPLLVCCLPLVLPLRPVRPVFPLREASQALVW